NIRDLQVNKSIWRSPQCFSVKTHLKIPKEVYATSYRASPYTTQPDILGCHWALEDQKGKPLSM
ncbi:Unknown protein, partial [Striga hermonthica]